MQQELVKAFEAQNWYVIAALILFGLIAFFKTSPFGRLLWDYLDIHKAKFVVPVFLAFATGFTASFSEGFDWRVSLFRGISAILWIATPAMGLHGALKDSPIPYSGSGGDQK
jgi:hypothetical protein